MNKAGIAIAGIALVAVGIGGGYWLAMHRTMAAASERELQAQAAGKKPLYWHDPMYPQQKFDQPGKSPFMDMDLVAVYGDEGASAAGVSISSRVVQNLGMRTAEVTEGTLEQRLESVGAVAFDERSVAVVQARVNGFVDRLYVRAPLDPVRKGQPLAELYVPDWVAAQEEYLSARRMAGTRLEALVEGALQRMRLAGMSEEQI